MADAKIGLTIHLLKPDKVASFDSALKKPGQDIRPLAAPLDGEFIALPSAPGEPPWVDVVRSALQNSGGLTLDSQSPAGLLVVRRDGNTFVLSFGHAGQKLEEQWLEPDYGLRVALNAIPRNKLIEIRFRRFLGRRRKSRRREAAGRGNSPEAVPEKKRGGKEKMIGPNQPSAGGDWDD